jgi:hypothetical protein
MLKNTTVFMVVLACILLAGCGGKQSECARWLA